MRGSAGRVGRPVLGPPAREQREPGWADRVGDALGQLDQAGGAFQRSATADTDLLGEGLGVELGAVPGRVNLQGPVPDWSQRGGVEEPQGRRDDVGVDVAEHTAAAGQVEREQVGVTVGGPELGGAGGEHEPGAGVVDQGFGRGAGLLAGEFGWAGVRHGRMPFRCR